MASLPSYVCATYALNYAKTSRSLLVPLPSYDVLKQVRPHKLQATGLAIQVWWQLRGWWWVPSKASRLRARPREAERRRGRMYVTNDAPESGWILLRTTELHTYTLNLRVSVNFGVIL